jgi:uncharacterized protein YndB with AHSA1/START domain
VRTFAVSVEQPRAELFDTLADIEALPRWAPEFCERIDLRPRGWRALTSEGEWLVEIEADERSGTIDLRFGDGEGWRRILPLRVVTLPGTQTVVPAVLAQWPAVDDVAFERECEVFGEALRRLGGVAAATSAGHALAV